jgi:hypothetical protein
MDDVLDRVDVVNALEWDAQTTHPRSLDSARTQIDATIAEYASMIGAEMIHPTSRSSFTTRASSRCQADSDRVPVSANASDDRDISADASPDSEASSNVSAPSVSCIAN